MNKENPPLPHVKRKCRNTTRGKRRHTKRRVTSQNTSSVVPGVFASAGHYSAP
jgi:hypothetical protein